MFQDIGDSGPAPRAETIVSLEILTDVISVLNSGTYSASRNECGWS
jgi:amino acid permease